MSAGTHPSSRADPGWQPRYLALLWGNRTSEPSLLSRIIGAIETYAPHLSRRVDQPGVAIFSSHQQGLPRTFVADTLSLAIIGTAFAGRTGFAEQTLAKLAEGAWEEIPHRLFSTIWGSYVAIGRCRQSGAGAIIRDPGGGLPAQVIDAGGVAVVSDQIPRWLASAIDRPLPVDKEALGQALAMPLLTTHRSLLRNVVSLPAGAVLTWRAKLQAPAQVWKPADFVGEQTCQPDRLRVAVLDAVAAYRKVYPRLLLELSGGLDSAIVLGAMAAEGGLDGIKSINFATSYAGGDERRTARDAAARAGIELVEFAADERDIDYRNHLAFEQPAQPVLYGLDPVLEAATSGFTEAFGAQAIFTGQGGDSVFYQMPSERVAIDLMRASGLSALLSQAVFDAARKLHVSSWRVQWRMVKDWLWGTSPERLPMITSLLGPAVKRDLTLAQLNHPWAADVRGLPPGKQLHILALANCQLFNGPTRRGQRFPLVHPLMAQPVLEASLRLPSYALSYGANDRALARDCSTLSCLQALPGDAERARSAATTAGRSWRIWTSSARICSREHWLPTVCSTVTPSTVS